MTHVFEDADSFAEDAVRGYCAAYARIVRPVSGGVIRSTLTPSNKVALVIGGGSGHYPAFAGYVGPGFADAAVTGDVFASPATRLVASVMRHADRGGGILLGFGNYAGDTLNFGFAAERLRAEGVDVRVLAVTDDVASAKADEQSRRRGVAGDVPVFKIAGAAAEAGMPLDTVERLARHANARTRSFGVAFGGCTLPGAREPLFTVPKGRMAIGLGIHGEPGIDETDIMRASALAALLVDRILSEAPADPGSRVAVVLNGLGNTKYEELFVLWAHVAAALTRGGVTVVAPLVGEYVTSLDMEGCSLTVTWLDEDLEPLWLAPCDTAALRIGAIMPIEPAPPLVEEAETKTVWPEASAASRPCGRAIAQALTRMADALQGSEAELGRIDAVAGDGDHGQGMTRGSRAAARAASEAAEAGAGARSVLAAASDAWADRAGGTSGAIWGLGLRAASTVLDDTTFVTPDQIGQAAMVALEHVMRLGGARPGDKTLVDAFAPFAETLSAGIAHGLSVEMAWAQAVQAAHDATEATASLLPRLGRARPHAERSQGHRDAGAVSFTLAARIVKDMIDEH
ncbi:dihydroxyacetone kinase family protein [Acidisoma cladoniae]|uniref:dihydroxyacetone kinase family protein n=1 Tax=Acidisoma cladoniae TaxID=3040935 RepID=UPI00254B07ED|nr:dihydroxyacetone kinase family protein [Acidisoma sp. PAMC 29798]